MNGSKFKRESGIALLMTVLVSGLFFVIASAIFKIALVELILSSTGRDSQYAFYAADTGAECALYWDRKYPGNGTDISGSAFSINEQNGPSNRGANQSEGLLQDFSAIQCGGGTVSVFCNGEYLDGLTCRGGYTGDTMIKIDQPSNNICAEIRVRKLMSLFPLVPASSSDVPAITEIVSRGYNTCNASNPKRVERAIRVTIQ